MLIASGGIASRGDGILPATSTTSSGDNPADMR
jgi:hypothetical protein